MSKIILAELLQQDIEDLKGVIQYKKYGLTHEQAQLHARGILANLEEHLEELIQK